MGIHDEITAEIADAFGSDLSDAVKQFDGYRNIATQSEDDWLTNGVGTTTRTETYGGRGVFSGYKDTEVDSDTIKMTDVKLICLQDEVTGIPQNDDIINGYRVIAVQRDPADVTYKIQLRKT